jgi:hypothetical protein
MVKTSRRTAKMLAAATAVPACVLIAGTAVAAASPAHPGSRAAAATRSQTFHVAQILNGAKLHHTYVTGGQTKSEPLTKPDDITFLGGVLYTAFQNGVGSQGEPSSDGNTDSTIVGYTQSGQVVHQWDVKGKVDGVTADPFRGALIATVNEDANSSIYTITPGASVTGGKIAHFKYNKPLPSKGGTDAISVLGPFVVVSASAPGTTGTATHAPAVYLVAFNSKTHIATVKGLLPDDSTAIVANVGAGHGKKVKLALTDPDSNSIVPFYALRFPGSFMLTSQADKEQIFVTKHGAARPSLFVLKLSQSVDDTVWTAPPPGRIFATDSASDSVDVVTGQFGRHVYVAVTPCDAGNAPSTCPGPGFPPNYLGSLNPFTGHVSRVPVTGVNLEPKGLLFLPNP